MPMKEEIYQPKRGQYRASYTADNMADAYRMCIEEALPVERVAHKFSIPVSTLKDRVRGRVDIDAVKSGPSTIFSNEQEAIFCDHLKVMAEIGYGYTRMETLNLASDFAIHLGLKPAGYRFSLKWLYGFLDRWPDLKVKKPRALEIARAKSATREAVDRYFIELNKILIKYNLKDQPSRIYNIDEKGLQMNHNPPKIIAGKHYKAQAITGGKSKTVTVIGGGNGVGHQVPPYFVFPGMRMQQALLDGATPGASGTVSQSGWSNTDIFFEYMKGHLEPILPSRDANNPVLILYDGHKSHVSLGLIEWAKENDIILFVLPPHCSHILQPMDVSCYGPFENAWNSTLHQNLRATGGSTITRYDVCKIACKVYAQTMTASNIQSAFKRCGIYPFNCNVVTDSIIAPSLTFERSHPVTVTETKLPNACSNGNASLFLEKRGGEVLSNVAVAKTRKTLSKVVAGKQITEDNILKQVKDHIESSKPSKSKEVNVPRIKKSMKKSVLDTSSALHSPQPGTSGLNNNDNYSVSDESETEILESEKCSVCNRFTPLELRHCVSLTLVKWGQCDRCDKWVHLRFCSEIKILRRGDSFLCPKCKDEE